MKKSLVSILLLSAFLSQDVFAEEEKSVAAEDKSVPQKMGETVKRGGEAAGQGIEKGAEVVGKGLKKGGEATVKGVKKAGEWVGKKLQQGGEKLEKASE
ncbi:MAG: hypothetical protein WAW02_04065 [Sideroxyarcus sp.]